MNKVEEAVTSRLNPAARRYVVKVNGGWLGSAGYQCDIDAAGMRVATSKPQFAAVFSELEDAEANARVVEGTVVAGTLVGFRFVEGA